MLFLQPSSCMNPFCLGCCLIFDRILWSIIAEYIFPSRDPMVIGLQFSTFFALFPGLGIIVIRVIFYCAGYIWCSMKRLHNFANAVPLSSWFSWFGPAAISALIFFNFSIRFPTVIRVQTSLISILLFKGYIVIYFYRPIWPKNFYRVELLSQSQRDWSLVCHYSAHPIMPSPITFVDIFCIVPGAWHIEIFFFYCGWPFSCYSLQNLPWKINLYENCWFSSRKMIIWRILNRKRPEMLSNRNSVCPVVTNLAMRNWFR